jgi:hypothetical protein
MNWGVVVSGLAGATTVGEPLTLREHQTNEFAAYAGSKSCQECHPLEYSCWAKSPHGLAQGPIHPESDGSAFDPPRSFRRGSQITTLRFLNGECQIVTPGLKTNAEVCRVGRVIGCDPIQQFLTPAAGGRWQAQEITHHPKSNQ